MSIPFKKADILLPKNCDMNKWSVVACDQYTSEPEYWNEVKEIVGNNPSTLNLTLPEIYLEDSDVNEKITKINTNMEELNKGDFFKEYKDSLFYIERTQSDGKIRKGIIGMVDLEDYSYEVGSTSMIRATEKTVIERIPPRVKVRENATLELPHIMILIDDDKKEIIEPLKDKVSENDIVYDFDLMQNGGHIRGYLLSDKTSDEVIDKLNALANKDKFNEKYHLNNKEVLLFAMGDGNHSLATAKACYEKLKQQIGEEALNSKARYALVELVNLHSSALEFEAIHRVLFNVDSTNLLNELEKYYDISYEECDGQKVQFVTPTKEGYLWIKNPKSNIAVGSIQIFLDDYLKENTGKIDYVHGDEVTKGLGKKEGNMSFLFDAMKKQELFKTVILDGALPRKTFSMGHSNDKRFYLEARKIK
jgi:uncharacterized protein (DUF1015 family)